MPDLGSAFTRATAYTHAPWCRRILHKPAATLLYATLLRLPRCVPLALQVPAHTFFGEDMRVVLPEGSACQLFCHGAIEEDVTAFLLAHVTEGKTFIDVGANVGYFSLLAATLVGPSGQVRAFEPAQRTGQILRHNTRRHGNITVQQKALWACRTMLPFHEYGRRYSALNGVRHHRLIRESNLAPTRSYDVESITLDEYCTACALMPDFIIIDAETAEPQILSGSRRTLARHQPFIAIEDGMIQPGTAGMTSSSSCTTATRRSSTTRVPSSHTGSGTVTSTPTSCLSTPARRGVRLQDTQSKTPKEQVTTVGRKPLAHNL
jgi:FkbM family methyltransferase